MNVYVLYHEYILLIVIGMARLLPITFFLPWFNSQVLGGMLAKNVITCFMLLGFLPLLSVQFPMAPAAHNGDYRSGSDYWFTMWYLPVSAILDCFGGR